MTTIIAIVSVIAAILVAWRGGKVKGYAERYQEALKTKREADEIEKDIDRLSNDDIRERLRNKR